MRVVLERQEAYVAEDGLKNGRPYVRPVQHPLELGRILHVALERRQEDLRRVREHDHAQTDGEILDIDGPPHFAPAPVANRKDTVTDDDRVDENVRHGAPEGQQTHTFQGL